MIKVKISVPTEKMIAKIKSNLVDKSVIDDLNAAVVPEIKRFMAAGTSPVKGKRRFAPYKDKDKYPGDRKAARPVNLFLSGALYNQIVAAKRTVLSFYLGISDLASDKIKIYAKANNLGENNIPERRFVPIKGEEYNVSIMRKIKNIIAQRIAEIIKK